MGKMKELQMEYGSSLKAKRFIYRRCFEIMDQKDIDYMISNARGNEKVAMNLALGDLKEE